MDEFTFKRIPHNRKMYAVAFITLLSVTYARSVDFTGKKLEGNIILPADLAEIPAGSCLKVELQDARRQDTAHKTIVKEVITTPELAFEKGKPLTYSLDLKGELEDMADYSVSVVANMAWCAEEGGKEWIRKGDLLNDTNFTVKLKDCAKPESKVCKGPLISLIKS